LAFLPADEIPGNFNELKLLLASLRWLTLVVLATQEAEIRMMEV
jgi:hypothetical protein